MWARGEKVEDKGVRSSFYGYTDRVTGSFTVATDCYRKHIYDSP